MTATARTAPTRMSGSDYLAWETAREDKHELVDGVPRLMAGGTHAHGRIAGNIAFGLRRRLPPGGCLPMQEQRVTIPNGNYRYPDVTVDCGRPRMGDLAAAEPRVVFEVESPSNREIDALERFEDFQSTPSIQEIVILSQTTARARIYRREGQGWRGETLSGLDVELALASIDCALPLAEVYEGVEFA